MKEIINNFATIFGDVSLTRGGFNIMVLMACIWVGALIFIAVSGQPMPDGTTIAGVTGTITGFMTTLGVAKHHKTSQAIGFVKDSNA